MAMTKERLRKLERGCKTHETIDEMAAEIRRCWKVIAQWEYATCHRLDEDGNTTEISVPEEKP